MSEDDIFSPAALAEFDYLAVHLGSTQTPERDLLAAVLVDGIRAALGELGRVPTKRRALEKRLAREWVFSNDTGYIFNFLSVCAALDIDAGYVRRLVRERIGRRGSG